MRLFVITILAFFLVQDSAAAVKVAISPQQNSSQQKKSKGKSKPAEKKAKEKKPTSKPKQSTAPPNASAEWDNLDKRRKEIMKELGLLKKKFDISSRAEKIKIRVKYQALIDSWSNELEPRMTELSFSVWEKKPTEELARTLAFNANRFELLAKTLDRMIAAKVDLKSNGQKSILQMGAKAHFDIHNFERARKLLAKADETKSLDLSGVALKKTAEEYLGLWKAELALRQKEAQAKDDEKNPRVELVTDKGSIVIELFENQAPNTVNNFVHLVEQKKYDGTLFYHDWSKFPVYAGDLLLKKDPSKNEALGYTIQCECYRDDARMHFRGSLSMILDLRRSKDTGGSAFAILRTPQQFRNPVKDDFNSRGNTVFGRVVSGMEIVDGLVKDDVLLEAKVLSKRKHPYVPYTSADLEKEKEKEEKLKKETEKKDKKKDSKDENKKEKK